LVVTRNPCALRHLLIAIVTLGLWAGGGSPASDAAPGLPQRSPASLTGALPPLRLLPDSAYPTTSPSHSAITPGEPGLSPHRQHPSRLQSRQHTHDSAVDDCMQMWDAGTHMTKQTWLRTCKRVETRLDTLSVDAVMPKVRK
jgi:hypothetical protein